MILKVIEKRNDSLIADLLKVWEDSVRGSHHFLSSKEISDIKKFVPGALLAVPHLVVLENDKGIPLAFMGSVKQQLEMLFVASEYRGQGLGRKLIEYAINTYKINELTVNEQNPEAVAFYEHLGFTTYRRTEKDAQGLPYPILYMRLKKSERS